MPKGTSDDWLSKLMRGDDVPDPNHDTDSHADSLHSLQKFTAIADRKGRLQFAAEAAIKGMGYEEKDVLHKPFWEASWFSKSEESRQAVRKSVLGALDGKSAECRVQVFTKDGDPVSVTFNITPLKGAEGDVVAIVAETDPLFAEPTVHHQDLHEEPGTSTEGLSSILDLMEEGYLEADSADGLTMVSPSAARLLGYQSPQDMLGKKTADLWTRPALRDKFLVELSRQGKVEKLRTRLLRKDHTEVSVQLKAQLTLNAQGDVVGSRFLFSPAIDPTDPEIEKRFRGLLQNPMVMVFVVDAQGTFLDASESAVQQLGYTLESLRKLDYADLVHPDDRPTMLAAHMELVNKGRQDPPVEMRLKTASGEELWVATCGAPVGERAEDQRFICMALDVTQRKRMEEELVLIKKAVESSSEAIGMSDPKGRHFYHNKAFTDLFEYTPEELDAAGGGPAAYADPKVAQEVFGRIMKGQSWSGETVMVSKSGRHFPVSSIADAIKDDAGNMVGLIGMFTDITERKKAEEALRKSEERYRLFAETIHDVIWTTNTELKVTYISPSVFHETGYTVEEAMAQTIDQKMTPASLQSMVKLLGEQLELEETGTADPGGWTRAEVEMYRKDGSTFWGEMLLSWQRDSEGHMTGLLGVTRDISERRRAEEALRESEAKFRALTEDTLDIVYSTDAGGNITFMGPQVARYDMVPKEMIGKNILEFIHPEDRERTISDFQRTVTTGDEFPSEFRIVDAQGKAYWIEEMGRVQRDESGTITGLTGVLRDITERKQADAALQRADRRYRSVISNPLNCVFVANEQGILVEANEATMKFLELSQDDIGKANILSFVHPDDLSMAATTMAESITRGHGDAVQMRVISKSGRVSWVEVYSNNLEMQGDHRLGVGIFHDITERKRASEALEEAERRYRAVFDNPLNIVFILSAENIILEANDYALQRFGLSRERLGKISVAEVVHPDDLWRAFEYRQHALEIGKPANSIELRMLSASGAEIWVETWVNSFPHGDRLYGLGFARDITAYKTAEKELKKSEEKLKDLVEKLRLSQEALSTPVVQIWDKVLALPLIGVIDDQRAQRIMEVVLRKIVETQSEILILDVTGVASIDTTVTNHLLQTVQSASMLGAKCILTGIRPEVAHAVTSLGMDMSKVIVKRDLQDGLRWALQNLGQGGSHPEPTYHHRR